MDVSIVLPNLPEEENQIFKERFLEIIASHFIDWKYGIQYNGKVYDANSLFDINE